jgi:hypothetical protein
MFRTEFCDSSEREGDSFGRELSEHHVDLGYGLSSFNLSMEIWSLDWASLMRKQ